MILAAHQPNFCPWLPYFDKMNKCDVFVLMINCQFEKNGYQNRAKVWDKWWTKPVKKGKKEIIYKSYTDGRKLVILNEQWILAMAMTLGIDTGKIRYDFTTKKRGTERIIELCKHYNCDKYLTNPEATEKYLDADMLKANDIKIVPCETGYKMHVFEAFDQFGIDGTIKILKKEKERCVTLPHSSND